jgi:sugar phosphate permease
MGSFLTELFPTRVRGSAQGLAYDFGRGVGAVFPTLVGYLSARFSLGHAIAFFALSAYMVMIVAFVCCRKRGGRN